MCLDWGFALHVPETTDGYIQTYSAWGCEWVAGKLEGDHLPTGPLPMLAASAASTAHRPGRLRAQFLCGSSCPEQVWKFEK